MVTPPIVMERRRRNAGPSWGCRFLKSADHVIPELVYRPLRALGTWVAVATLHAERRHSRDFLTLLLGRRATVWDVFRHFFTFEEALMRKIRVSNGRTPQVRFGPGGEAMEAFMTSGEPGLLGSFHFGDSDLLGFLVGPKKGQRIFMVRLRMDNSHETDALGHFFGDWITFIWVNQAENLLFALKDAVSAGGSIALKCDRLGFSSKNEVFDFLGASRIFPFTIYHLALIFDRPVLLTVGVPDRDGATVCHSSPAFRPDRAASKGENLARARAHFQAFLTRLEALLRTNPYLWFNFAELNPVHTASTTPAPPAVGQSR